MDPMHTIPPTRFSLREEILLKPKSGRSSRQGTPRRLSALGLLEALQPPTPPRMTSCRQGYCCSTIAKFLT